MEAIAKVVVITGATRGIGKNMALHFAKHGYTVIGTGRDEQLLNELEPQLRQFSPRSHCLHLDVQKHDSVQKAAGQMRDIVGSVDVWINNAGAFAAIGPTWEVDPQVWLNDVSTNLFGVFHCVQAAVPLMLEQGSGRIINVVGGGTIGEFKYGNGYGTSKTAIARFTENLNAELQDTGLMAFALDPGLNDTDMTKYQRETEAGQKYFPRISQAFAEHRDAPAHLAPTLAYLLAEGKLDAYNGRIVSIHEDADKLQEKAAELQVADYFKLRMKKLEDLGRS
ncbi:SDR family NAD(P)-dependent oxidoreductase [Paenibacillus agricola]|uniref:SDR family oxidoreductase n=1 Tax=Paenibacillus agricola TaxID=2716264 RepID=A0ABX0J937_9BACL|nr:SDR family oxidoreductase [Paenibacillus agricola]NHN32879.1 SDR family oxidoreductase [Paenibacillus agricola]